MPELVLDLLKYVFLAVLYIFVARAVKAVYLELRPARSRAAARPTRSPVPAPPQPPSRKQKKAPRKISIIEGPLKGQTVGLSDEVTIGRADKCKLVLDDTYVSQMHARVYTRGDGYAVEDLGSTNGTYLNRRRITTPADVRRGDRIKIGKSVLELRR
jgi:pSer/pThr/pTyr-binding forkhead associated (FHA) protein